MDIFKFFYFGLFLTAFITLLDIERQRALSLQGQWCAMKGTKWIIFWTNQIRQQLNASISVSKWSYLFTIVVSLVLCFKTHNNIVFCYWKTHHHREPVLTFRKPSMEKRNSWSQCLTVLIQIVYSHCVLTLCTHIAYSHCVLTLRTHIMYSYLITVNTESVWLYLKP